MSNYEKCKLRLDTYIDVEAIDSGYIVVSFEKNGLFQLVKDHSLPHVYEARMNRIVVPLELGEAESLYKRAEEIATKQALGDL